MGVRQPHYSLPPLSLHLPLHSLHYSQLRVLFPCFCTRTSSCHTSQLHSCVTSYMHALSRLYMSVCTRMSTAQALGHSLLAWSGPGISHLSYYQYLDALHSLLPQQSSCWFLCSRSFRLRVWILRQRESYWLRVTVRVGYDREWHWHLFPHKIRLVKG